MKRKIFFSPGKDSKQSSKGTFITLWLWLQQQAMGVTHLRRLRGFTAALHPMILQQQHLLLCQDQPALPTRERKTLQIGSDRHKCFLPTEFHISAVFWMKLLKAIFLCQWISPQYFFFNLSSSDLLEFPKSKNSVKINNTAMYLTKIPFQSTNSPCTQQKAQKLSGEMLAWAE